MTVPVRTHRTHDAHDVPRPTKIGEVRADPLVPAEAPRRVLYVLKRYPRLSETFVVREVLGLEAAGVEVGIDALLPPEAGPRHADVDRVRAEHRVLPRHPSARQWPVAAAHLRIARRSPRRWLRAAREARRHGTTRRFLQAGMVADRAVRTGARHLHAHFATAAADVAAVAADLAGCSWSVTAHAKDIYTAEHAALLPGRLASAAAVVTVTEHNVAHLEGVLEQSPAGAGVRGGRRPPVLLVRNGVPIVPAHGPAAGGPVVCVARLVDKKGVDVLVDALAYLLRVGRSVDAVIVGDGPRRAELEARVEQQGLRGRVRFLGAVDAAVVAEVYALAQLVVLPCRISADGDRDGLPTILVEALARGVPVVSTDVVGIPELVRHEETGLLVPPDDPCALAAAIARLLDDPSLAAELGRTGAALVAAHYAAERSTSALLDAFAVATSARAGTPPHADRPRPRHAPEPAAVR